MRGRFRWFFFPAVIATLAITVVVYAKVRQPAARRALLKCVADNPRVELLLLDGYEKGFGWPLDDEYSVQNLIFRIRARSGTLVTIHSPTPALFAAREDHVHIGEIGPYSLGKSRRDGNSLVTAGWDFGPQGDFADLPFRVRTINDVIDRYDDMIAFIAKQPRRQNRISAADNQKWGFYVSRERGRRAATQAN